MPEHKAARALQLATDALFVLCFGAVMVRLLLYGAEYISNMPALPNNWLALGIALLWLCALLFAAYAMRRWAHTAGGRFFARRRGAFLAFVCLLAAQLIVALCCYTPCGWDPQVLITTANDLLTGAPYTGTYFHQNPNNLFMLGCFRYFFALLNRFGVTNYLPWAVAVGVCCVTLSVLFLFLLVRRLFGIRMAWLSFLLCAPIAALSPWIAVPYSDTYSMPFAIGCVYFYVLARQGLQATTWRGSIYAALCGALLALGTRIKPTVLLLVVAVLVVELLCLRKKAGANSEAALLGADGKPAATPETPAPATKQPAAAAETPAATNTDNVGTAEPLMDTSLHHSAPQGLAPRQGFFARVRAHGWLRIIAGFALGAVLTAGACAAFQQHASRGVLDPARAQREAFSATHYLMMGLSQPHGSYAYEDMQFTASMPGSAAKVEANLQEAAHRIDKMGPTGYAAFLWRKLNFSWDDGTFFFGREGSFYWGEAPQQSAFAKAVQSVFRADGRYYGALALWQQAQWILLLLLMLCGTLYRKGTHAKWVWLARIATLGLVCFLLVFEARSRYVYHFLPLLCLAATGGLLWLTAHTADRLARPKNAL